MKPFKPNLKLVHPKPQPTGRGLVEANGFSVSIDKTLLLKGLSFQLVEKQLTCIIGPSGSGKSTLLRSLNRINDNIPGFSATGQLFYAGENIYSPEMNPVELRRKIGMVFQKPCVFPQSIVDNVLFGLQKRPRCKKDRAHLSMQPLKDVHLWDEVAHRLHDRADTLSIGQQQRLCIARTLAIQPDLIMLDEPTSSLDPLSTLAIESLLMELKVRHNILLVTHNIQQARRIADNIIFLCDGQIVEQGRKEDIFTHPKKTQTRNYLDNQLCDC
ncbi:MAG: phosphate ABC transporter ATP-binding protein [Gammaproteobacteria bacterium]|nr:MAG: phosphate ABC transporter ATP-binding protein [Gammaproteobacteria bacterium]